jgi:hypothetical protein
MSLVANGFPVQEFGVSPELYSRWVAVWNPVVFNWIRKDALITSVSAGGVGARLQLSGSWPAGTAVGQLIRVVTKEYDDVYEIVALPTSSTIEINASYTMSSTGYVNMLEARPNYYIELQVRDADNALIGAIRYTPNEAGLIGADISGILQSKLNNDDDYDFEDGGQQFNTNAYCKFTVSTKEFWGGSANSFVNEGNNWFAVNGAFQIGHEFNGNYIDFVIANVNKTGKFLSPFEVPTAFANYPYTLQFVWDANALPNDLEVATFTNYANAPEQLPPDNDLTGNLALSSTGRGQLNTIIFPLGGVGAVDNRKNVYVWLQESAAHNRVSEQRKVKIMPQDKQGCNLVFLRWLAPSGCYGYYLFEGNYRESLSVDLSGTYNQSFNRIDTLKGFSKVLKKTGFKKFQVGMTGLDQNDATGIETLLYSPQVYRLTPNASTGFYNVVEVIVEPGTFQIKQAKQGKFDVEFSIVFPEIFNQGA